MQGTMLGGQKKVSKISLCALRASVFQRNETQRHRGHGEAHSRLPLVDRGGKSEDYISRLTGGENVDGRIK